jgi:plastocyanin
VPGGPVVVTATDEFRFEPARVEVGRGETLRIRLTNAGSYPHNLVAPGLQLRSDTVSGTLGDTETTFSVDTSEVGTFRFICTYHDQAGMTGEIVVH